MLAVSRRVLRCAVQPGPVGLPMTDDLLVATQGGDQCDVRPSSGPPEQPRVGTDALSQHVSGAAAVPLLLAAWRSGKPRSLGTPGHLGVPLRPSLPSVSRLQGRGGGQSLLATTIARQGQGPDVRRITCQTRRRYRQFSAAPNPAGRIRSRTALAHPTPVEHIWGL